MKLSYSVNGSEIRYQSGGWPVNGRTAAEFCAEDFYLNHGGHSVQWPIDITIFCNGAQVGKWKVDVATIKMFRVLEGGHTR